MVRTILMDCTMPAFKDLSGTRFGKLVVQGLHPERSPNGGTQWICRCDCGNEKTIRIANLGHNTNSCGCIRNTQQGMTRKHRLWARWSAMIDRCEREGDKNYPLYGGRGIKVCERWHSFQSFLDDMETSFYLGASLDRYPDNNGNYEPTNVRWATAKQQVHNRRSSQNIETPWGIMNVAEAAARIGMNRERFSRRVDRGWTTAQLFDPKNNGCLTKWDRRRGARNA